VAIGRPMLPVPMNAIFSVIVSSRNHSDLWKLRFNVYILP
jgi:hypothetical protein